ncbi:DTW domain-containing protein [Alteromonas ponticola]|uniref:tRNA-uridine aminocarboxypropyltransferase n=1 Tax=Alteromonas aquimaris TaxID=2998417 RepID=A0ABT3P800_9ALTE|nr:tRNA-uridine aminocarboxypropyltransferase [Alteromonas aquimaris]MCW8108894.1 DTW domain-containing protein [Alteromonas aquimaris]
MRPYCSHCHYPASTCLCKYIAPVSCPVSLIILQHSNEASHAKNTVRLLKLAIPETRIIKGKTTEDFLGLSAEIMPNACAVVYPTANSVALENYANSTVKPAFKQLIFIDGSWRQAYAIWKANSWLHALPQFHLNNAPKSDYEIRHVKMQNSLSTLEAVSHTVTTLFSADTTPLIKLQAAFQQKWRSPLAHRRK